MTHATAMNAAGVADAIGNLITKTARDWDFRKITWEAGLGGSRGTDDKSYKAKTIQTRPTSATWQESTNTQCDGPRQQRDAWNWILILHFDHAVDPTTFEEFLAHQGLRIERSEGQPRQVDIELLDADYQWPATNEPSHGLRATYNFAANLSRL